MPRQLLAALDIHDPSIPWNVMARGGGIVALVRVDGDEWHEVGWVSGTLAARDLDAAARVLFERARERCCALPAALML